MKYILKSTGLKIKYTHAGHGTANKLEIGSEFVEINTKYFGNKNIFMHRNPLDTAVSLFFQLHKKDFVEDSADYANKFQKLSELDRLPPSIIDDFVTHPIWGVENICKFNRGWIDYFRIKNNTLVVSYEDMSYSTEETINRVMEFLNVHDQDPYDLVLKSSFENMKAAELSGKGRELGLHGINGSDSESMKVRKGKIRGYVNYVDSSTIEKSRIIADEYKFQI